ncbi:DUF1493 family protein [Bradyrhizobium sp. Pear76]|nr:DUF1493 family protein [Bradyrhizobium oropedii]
MTTMGTPVGPLTKMYLSRCGYSDSQIDSWNSETRLLQDIGLAGDNAWDEFSRMHREFGVDLTGFEVDRYFPPELSWTNLAMSLLWRTELGNRLRNKYPPISLGLIECVLAAKKWEFR